MKKLKLLSILYIFTGLTISIAHAQTTLLDQTLLTQQSFDTFTAVSVTGTQTWSLNTSYGAVCSGYSGNANYDNEDWLISPVADLSQTSNAQLTFSHTRGSASVVNVGVAEGWYKVFATASYTGNPSTTTWVELTGVNQAVPTAWQYVSSGPLAIPDAAKSATTRFAFKYISTASQSATWEIKNVKLTGTTQSSGSDAVFKITNWNTEWLGCTEFGPTDEDLQIHNVAAAMQLMDSDIYCIQEVINTAAYPSIATIVSILGSDTWAGTIVPANTGDCNQRQGIIYKKARVQLVSAAQLNSGNAAEGNSYYYNWTSGRYPALYTVNLVAGGTLVPVSLVNIHAKAEDGDAASYTRRLGGSEGLKTILDGASYNTKNLIVIGDFNDYLIGTTNTACNCTASPYQNFMTDPGHYNGITSTITDVNTSYGTHPIIENIIISDELADNYVANSVAQEVSVSHAISNYHNTTSDHLPVSARFQFSTLSAQQTAGYSENTVTIYPNPVKDQLNIAITGMVNDAATEIYDGTGRQVRYEKVSTGTINVSALPAGIYILKMGSKTARFIKE